MTQSIIRSLSLGALLLGLSGPALAAQESNPGQPFAEILAALGPCNIPPVWGKKYAGADRFVPVLDGGAYCDKETGLVWEGRPGDTNEDGTVDVNDEVDYVRAIGHCTRLEVDGRKGWKLPLIEQLASLQDTNSTLCAGGGPCLPDGHPFQDVQPDFYWSVSTVLSDPDAWIITFGGDGRVVTGDYPDDNTYVWCVRGGEAYDGVTNFP